MEYRSIVSFQVYHSVETPINMSPGLMLFFGLSGDSVLHTVHASHILHENEIYIASPLTLYRVDCHGDSALLFMTIAPQTIRQAVWEESVAADCLL